MRLNSLRTRNFSTSQASRGTRVRTKMTSYASNSTNFRIRWADSMTLPHHHKRTDCRLCSSRELECVLHLTPTPPANALVPAAEKGKSQVAYPLDVYRCADCGHLQLLDIVDPNVLFTHYLYVSSTSPVMVSYLKDQCAAIVRRLKLKPGDLVVEFGSNDGTLLRFFKEAGMRGLGVGAGDNLSA